jgi:AraC-like DNA-binding protein
MAGGEGRLTANPESAAGTVPVKRAELVTQDMELIRELISQLYAEHRARFSCADPSRVDGSVRWAAADGLSACLMQYGGFGYDAEISPNTDPHAVVVLHGDGVISTARGELYFTGGDTFMPPSDLSHVTRMHDLGLATVQVPWAATGQLAEEVTGLPAADLRFESMSPVSAARQGTWTRTTRFICGELVSSDATEVSPLMAGEMMRLAAAALLETFPNTTMTVAYTPGPGRVPPAAVHQAAAFIDAHAGQPITLAQIAAAAGVTGRALRYAFRRHYGTTPAGYLRQARLERAHQELAAGEPGGGVTVAAVARNWGWASPSQFAAAYQRRYGQPPGHTLRT